MSELSSDAGIRECPTFTGKKEMNPCPSRPPTDSMSPVAWPPTDSMSPVGKVSDAFGIEAKRRWAKQQERGLGSKSS